MEPEMISRNRARRMLPVLMSLIIEMMILMISIIASLAGGRYRTPSFKPRKLINQLENT